MISIIFENFFKKPGFFHISLKKTEKPDPKNPGFFKKIGFFPRFFQKIGFFGFFQKT